MAFEDTRRKEVSEKVRAGCVRMLVIEFCLLLLKLGTLRYEMK